MSSPINAQVDEDTGLRYYTFNDQRLVSATSIRKAVGMPLGLHNWVVNQHIDAVLDDAPLLTIALDKEGAELMRRIKRRNGSTESDAEARLRARRAARAVIRKEADSERDTAAALGTAVHEAAEYGIKADSLSDEDERKPFMLQYERWLEEQKPVVLWTEGQLFSLTHGYAGSFDLIADVDGRRTLIDIKTGRDIYTDHALQLALYFGADFVGGYDPHEEQDVIYEEATRFFQSCVDMAVLHLRPDKYELVRIPLTDELSAAALDMVHFAHWLLAHPTIDTLL